MVFSKSVCKEAQEMFGEESGRELKEIGWAAPRPQVKLVVKRLFLLRKRHANRRIDIVLIIRP